jgi:hypothetical protein
MTPTLLRLSPIIFGCLLAASFWGLAREAKLHTWSFNSRAYDPTCAEDVERNRDGVRTLRIAAGVVLTAGLIVNLVYWFR